MFIKHSSKIKPVVIPDAGIKDTSMKILTAGKGNYILRKFTVKKNGHTPLHKHSWEHEVYVTQGNGLLQYKKGKKLFNSKLTAGTVVYIKPFEMHQFLNNNKKDFEFLCIVPGKK
ncbi:TPA: cupin domain-containing protein [Candidatus Woesearchaeota archaeon]|nr:cupin domain-containing protein [Candidatus Woesearchaeota archaeon]